MVSNRGCCVFFGYFKPFHLKIFGGKLAVNPISKKTTMELIESDKPREFTHTSKKTAFKVLEYTGTLCKKCNQLISIRSYFNPAGEGEKQLYTVTHEYKRTIYCKCGMKVILRNGIVFYNPDKHKFRMKYPGERFNNNKQLIKSNGKN